VKLVLLIASGVGDIHTTYNWSKVAILIVMTNLFHGAESLRS